MFSRGFFFVNTCMENTTQPPSLTLADLASIQNIIEAASTRGAFRANELSVVGAMYDKLNAFVQASQPAAPAEATEQSPTQGET
jgi:hypothetical protein